MSFFIRNTQGGSKRKQNGHVETSKGKKKNIKKSVPDDNESIASTDEEFAEENQSRLQKYESEEEEEETAQEKRIRLAKKYLEQIEEEGSLKERTKLKTIKGKRKNQEGIKCVQCIAVSTDGKFLVVGDSGSKDIKVFCADSLNHIKNLQGHRDSVTGLVFRKDTHTLYSASADRSVKVWNLDDMAYVESLFGHQSAITSIDALARERAITSGGFDKTIRIWKIVEESQLIFNGHGGSIDAVKLINEENFFSCGDDGQLCVWGCLKKKPLCSVPDAHGRDEANNQPMWISSIATLLNTDLVASGSRNGVIRLWQCSDSFRSLNSLFDVNLTGFVNALLFTPDGTELIAGIGQEHRLGRWWRIPEAKNSIVIIPLIQTKNK
ncbi:U3 small nuclear riboprotein factor 55K isoform X5 [Calliopsis andreniformis]|uniref:U3 small nuclear riboprotein factor 55K isoform X5 n=1 Tax=Calliopsis andreniformis TaxID=337506 RepID=UPI003FCDD40F